ncbi:MAG: YihY/virulence factor BrkB family protein [Rhodobacteraceae bacterium]|nr:YihY/virulence factor BrkB family protein [Paracoccaceae bacterium]
MGRWLAALAGAWRIVGERHLGLIAAGVAFFALFSLFPGLAALIALWGFWADPAAVAAQLGLLAEFVPEDAFALIEAQVATLVASNEVGLHWASVLSLLVALWSARSGVGAMIQGLNAVHGVENRGGLGHLLAALALTMVLMGLGIVALAAVVVAPVVLAFVPLGPWTGLALSALRWALAVAVIVLGVALLFRHGPNRPRQRTRLITPGLLIAVGVWAAASAAFSQFLAGLADYNRIHGSIGAVIALLTWFYLGAFVVLLGAALDSELARLGDAGDPAAERPRR